MIKTSLDKKLIEELTNAGLGEPRRFYRPALALRGSSELENDSVLSMFMELFAGESRGCTIRDLEPLYPLLEWVKDSKSENIKLKSKKQCATTP